jgi:hypothetical protein
VGGEPPIVLRARWISSSCNSRSVNGVQPFSKPQSEVARNKINGAFITAIMLGETSERSRKESRISGYLLPITDPGSNPTGHRNTSGAAACGNHQVVSISDRIIARYGFSVFQDNPTP